MNNPKHLIKKYYKQICSFLPASARKDNSMKTLKRELTEYAIHNPNLEFEDLVARFGHPIDVASMLCPNIIIKNKADRLIPPKHIIAIILAAFLFIFSVFLAAVIINGKIASKNYYETYITITATTEDI